MTIFDRPTARVYELQPGDVQAAPAAWNAPRTLVASAQRLKLDAKSTRDEIKRPTTREWQKAAWDYYDELGEVKFAFGLKGSIMSRVRLYPALVTNPSEPPTATRDISDEFDLAGLNAESVTSALEVSETALDELNSAYLGGLSEMMRVFAINVDVAGELFLVRDDDRYIIASVEELTAGDSRSYRLKQSRDSGSGTRSKGKVLTKDTYVARIWRAHPRWSKEPDSTMLGVLTQCEKLSLLDRTIRTTARSRMNAGLVFIPDGIRVNPSDEESEETLEETLFNALTAPVDSEAAATTVVPLILRGPVDLGEKIKLLEVLRTFDPALATAADRALERLMQGIDIPKDMVTGLANVRYSNAVVIDDGMYKAHIEPLCLFIADTLTTVWYRPLLRNAGVPEDIVKKAVIWYDPSEIVTRPDRSAAANEGFDRNVLSETAWRAARGFSESDAPDTDELLRRIAFANAQLPPDTSVALLEHFAPDVFDAMRQKGQENAGMPADISSLLQPGSTEEATTQSEPVVETAPAASEEPPGGGTMPPPPGQETP